MTRTARCALIAALLGAALFRGGAAAGGGATWDVDKDYYTPGEAVTARARIARVSERGWLDDGPYYVYLAPSNRRSWDLEFAERISTGARVGRVRSSHVSADGSRALVETTFTVPELRPGDYEILHCNRPCTNEVGDLTRGSIRIVESAAEGRAWARTDRVGRRLDSSLSRLRWRLNRRTRSVRRALQAELAREREATAARMDAVLKDVRADVRAAKASAESAPGFSAFALLLAFGAGVGSAWLALRRRPPDGDTFGGKLDRASVDVDGLRGEEERPVVVVSNGNPDRSP